LILINPDFVLLSFNHYDKIIMKKIAVCLSLLAIVPLVAFAQTAATAPTVNGTTITCPATSGSTLCTIIQIIVAYFNVATVLLMGFAVVMFVWFVVQYYVKPNEERAKAGQYVMYSVIGFFVILSMWGLVNILSNTFGGLDNSSNKPTTVDNINDLFPTN
jgi:hypothetical protein